MLLSWSNAIWNRYYPHTGITYINMFFFPPFVSIDNSTTGANFFIDYLILYFRDNLINDSRKTFKLIFYYDYICLKEMI